MRQCNQCGAVIDAPVVLQQRGIHAEYVATQQLDVTGNMVDAIATFAALRLQRVFFEELRHGQRGKLHAQYRVSLRGQPGHVQ